MTYYKRNLPHYQPLGYAFFVTARLTGTIPTHIFEKFKNEYESELNKIAEIENYSIKKEMYYDLHKKHFVKYEKILDSASFGKKWIQNTTVAQVIKDTLHFYDEDRYDLISYSIMPNHIHVVLLPNLECHYKLLNKHTSKNKSQNTFYFLSKIMQDIKKYSAKESNKILNRSGKFWQHESYDHVIRDKKELRKVVKYILNNPVKAGLCKTSVEWKWNYYNPKFLL